MLKPFVRHCCVRRRTSIGLDEGLLVFLRLVVRPRGRRRRKVRAIRTDRSRRLRCRNRRLNLRRTPSHSAPIGQPFDSPEHPPFHGSHLAARRTSARRPSRVARTDRVDQVGRTSRSSSGGRSCRISLFLVRFERPVLKPVGSGRELMARRKPGLGLDFGQNLRMRRHCPGDVPVTRRKTLVKWL